MLKNLLFVGVALFMWGQGAFAILESKEAEAFMTGLGDKVIALLTDRSLSQQEKTSQFQEILETKFNLKAIGKFVLGRYWKQASEEQKKEFLTFFKATTIASYASRFQDYTSEKFEILGSRPEKDGGVTVLTRIMRPNGQAISVDWKIFEKNGKMAIYDVILEGISMGITQRSEYASVIQKGGGNISVIIDALRKRAGTK
jgi:phospholipid transport system substrate-binding protein